MKTVPFSISIIFAFVLLIQIIPGNVAARTENFLTYTNVNYGFTIKYPSDWKVYDSNIATMGITFKSPDGLGNVEVAIKKTSLPLDILISHYLLEAKAHGFRLAELNNNTHFLSGHPAIRIIGIESFGKPGELPSSTGSPHELKMMVYDIVLGGKLYHVRYVSPPENYLTYLPIAQHMIDSFQIIHAE
jgi:hypothetical protein